MSATKTGVCVGRKQAFTSWTRLAPPSMASVSLSNEKPEMRIMTLAAVKTNSSSARICERMWSPPAPAL